MESKHYVEDIDFQKYWLILRRHWLPGTTAFVVIVVLATSLAFLKKPTYSAVGRLVIKKTNPTSGLVTEASAKIGQLESLNFMNTPLDTEAEVIRSIPLIQKTIDTLKLKDKEGKPLKPEDFLKQLTVKGIKGTDILEISFKSKSPQEAAQIVNTLIDLYKRNNILSNRAEAVAARQFITQQLPASESTVRQAEVNLRIFREKNNIVALEEEANTAVEVIAELDKKLDQTRTELEGVTARVEELQRKTGLNSRQAMALNSLTQSPGVQEALEEVHKLENKLAAEQTRFRDQNPNIVNLKLDLEAKRALLQDRISQVLGSGQQVPGTNLQMGEQKQKLIADLVNAEVQRQDLANQVTYLYQARSAYKQRVNVIPRLQQGQRDLQRQVDAAQSSYQALLKNLQEVRIAENQNVGNASVLAYASVADKPVGPKKKLLLGAGLVGGCMFYVVVAFLLDLTDPSIKTAKDVRELYGYSWLGMIPNSKKKGFFHTRKQDEFVPLLPVRDAPQAVSSQAYRMLQANLKFLSPDKELKVVVVTSSVSKEGKSTVSANLAVAMAQLGHRVLLIDADLHHPMQHHIWHLANAVGLSNVIVNRSEFGIAVREVMDKLDVLPSGVIPPNPLALLDSKRMNSLVEEFSQTYDFVILDTPPLILAADALSLSKMTDGVLLVARPGILDRVSATAAKEFLVQSGQKVLGLVINGVRVGNEPDSYFHHAKSYYQEDLTTSKEVTTAQTEKISNRS
ncbi:polysaccharide biosynthesis tyrosine autokinase [Microcoleus sp. ZQ-A2]|nr:polysaccharide biosynthesis tyrosine autokinase [Microcoleus sp. FACHB-1]